ncbi:MAG: hypothetical protein ACPG5P_01735 [Saprospiraceae bacterium]
MSVKEINISGVYFQYFENERLDNIIYYNPSCELFVSSEDTFYFQNFIEILGHYCNNKDWTELGLTDDYKYEEKRKIRHIEGSWYNDGYGKIVGENFYYLDEYIVEAFYIEAKGYVVEGVCHDFFKKKMEGCFVSEFKTKKFVSIKKINSAKKLNQEQILTYKLQKSKSKRMTLNIGRRE